MLLTQTYGLPATTSSFVVSTYSLPGTGSASGTAPGHIDNWVCPGDGCQTVCALTPPNANTAQKAASKCFITITETGDVQSHRATFRMHYSQLQNVYESGSTYRRRWSASPRSEDL